MELKDWNEVATRQGIAGIFRELIGRTTLEPEETKAVGQTASFSTCALKKTGASDINVHLC